MPRILILDPIAEEGIEMLQAAKASGIDYEVKTGLKGNDLKKALAEADGAICRGGGGNSNSCTSWRRHSDP